MSANLLLGKVYCVRRSIPGKLNRTYRAPSKASPPNPNFGPEYLVQTCGFRPDEARGAFEYLKNLKSPEIPDAVLQFLRDIGIPESVVRKAVYEAPRILCSSVEKKLKPNIDKLQEFGFSMEEITDILYRFPRLLRYHYGPKLEFLMKETDCAKSDVISYPNLLLFSLEKRLIPRSLVRQTLQKRGVPLVCIAGFMDLPEDQFVNKYILPYQHVIPGLLEAYEEVMENGLIV